MSIKLIPPSPRLPIADSQAAVRHVFIRDLVLPCSIGVHRHEQAARQRVRVNVDLAVDEGDEPLKDDLKSVVCYEDVAEAIRAIVREGHVKLVETLAERIAGACLRDRRVRTARVRVEKLDAFADAASVGVEIERQRPPQ